MRAAANKNQLENNIASLLARASGDSGGSDLQLRFPADDKNMPLRGNTKTDKTSENGST